MAPSKGVGEGTCPGRQGGRVVAGSPRAHRAPAPKLAPIRTTEPGATERSVCTATKGPSCSQAGAAWLLTAALHLQGQGDDALRSFSPPSSQGWEAPTNGRGPTLLLSWARPPTPGPACHTLPPPPPLLSLASAVHILSVGVIPGCRHQHLGRWTQQVACCVG